MNRIAKAGSVICVSYGAYSDFCVAGFFKVLEDFKPSEELEDFLDENPDQREDYSFDRDSYLARLLAKNLLEEIDHGELYLGAYRCADDFSFRP